MKKLVFAATLVSVLAGGALQLVASPPSCKDDCLSQYMACLNNTSPAICHAQYQMCVSECF